MTADNLEIQCQRCGIDFSCDAAYGFVEYSAILSATTLGEPGQYQFALCRTCEDTFLEWLKYDW